jgi:hypothetical protein
MEIFPPARKRRAKLTIASQREKVGWIQEGEVKIGNLFGFLLLTGLAGGCAYMDSTLTLSHTPVMEKAVSTPYPVFLERVSDRRPNQNRIGCKKNGYGSETADLFLDVALTDWFGGVMNEEFRRSGLSLAPNDPRAARIDVDLLDFFVEPEANFGSFHLFAVVHGEVTVRLPMGTTFARRFAAHADETFMMVTDGSYTKMLEEAMMNWMAEAVVEVLRLLQSQARASAGWRVLS